MLRQKTLSKQVRIFLEARPQKSNSHTVLYSCFISLVWKPKKPFKLGLVCCSRTGKLHLHSAAIQRYLLVCNLPSCSLTTATWDLRFLCVVKSALENP